MAVCMVVDAFSTDRLYIAVLIDFMSIQSDSTIPVQVDSTPPQVRTIPV